MRSIIFIAILSVAIAIMPAWAQLIGEFEGKPLGSICDTPPLPLAQRLENRDFPSVFSAWGGVGWSSVLNQPHLTDLEQMAQHDLYWCCLHWNHDLYYNGSTFELREVVPREWQNTSTERRDAYIDNNPNMVFLAGFDWAISPFGYFPEDSPYWRYDENGNIITEYHSGWLNLSHPDIQQWAIQRVEAIAKCGLYDGIFVDTWLGLYDGINSEGTLAILKAIRKRVRPDFLIVVNTSVYKEPNAAPYINGLFLESEYPGDAAHLEQELTQLEHTLAWAEVNLRQPRINALEFQALRDQPLDSPANLRWMRAMTALGLTFTDGYVLFMTDDWEGRHMHWHYWYDFWDADLGQPVGAKSQLYQETDGLYIREFTNGWAVYNHSGSEQTVTLPELASGVASGLEGLEHTLPNLDGEMYLRAKPANPADVNGDGVVNLFDLTLVAQAISTGVVEGDVNGDGVVNVFDLVFIANKL